MTQIHRKAFPPGARSRTATGGARHRRRRFVLPDKRRLIAGVSAVLLPTALIVQVAGVPATNAAVPAEGVGQGFTVSASDLSYILKQIKIAESHVAKTTAATGPCGALLGTGPNQLPSPLLSMGLRTVDGSCNNLVAGNEQIGAADQLFPRLANPVFQ